jgi:hypothetical protein
MREDTILMMREGGYSPGKRSIDLNPYSLRFLAIIPDIFERFLSVTDADILHISRDNLASSCTYRV